MPILAIRNDDEHKAALKRLQEIFLAEKGTPEGDELELLAAQIEAYENEHYPFPESDPDEAAKFRADQLR